MRRPRIALLCGNLTPERDGVADYTVRLARALAVSADVVLLAGEPGGLGGLGGPGGPGGPGGLTARGGPGGCEVVDLGGTGWGPRRLEAAARALRALSPDVVHVQFAPSAFGFSPMVGLLPALPSGRARWVTTLHEYGWWSWPSWVPARAWRRCERGGPRSARPTARWDRETLLLAPRSDSLVVTNAEHAAIVRARLGVEPHIVPLPPNIVPAAHRGEQVSAGGDLTWREAARGRARANLRRRLGAGADAPVVVFFGFVHPVKGVRYLIDAVGRLAGEERELRLVVAGGFTSQALPAAEAEAFRRELAEHTRRAGVAERVTFTGHRPADEVSGILLGADVCVLPFTAGVTGRSGALAAALAHDLPAVVTAADPPDPDLVDGRTAVVVHGVRDPAPLAAGIRRLLDAPELRATVAAGGRGLVAGRDWPAVAAAHLRLYRRLPPRGGS